MKKLNKIALSLSSVAAVAAPMAAVVSCGDSGYAGRYDSDNDGEINILTSFSDSGDQYKALEKIIEQWNARPDKVARIGKLIAQEGGYKTIAPFLSESFEAGDKKKIPNMVISYPDTIGTLGKYDMAQSLTSDAAIKGLFNNEFTDINDQIGGVKPGGFYALPFAKSVDMMSVNTPVMAQLFKLAVDAHVLTDNDSLLTTADASLAADKMHLKLTEALASGDAPEVQRLWGTTLKADTTYTAGHELGDITDVMSKSSVMLDFIAHIYPRLTVAQAGQQWILGVDSATNFIYQALAQEVGNDIANKFLFHKGANGYIDYAWDDKNSPAWKAFAKVYGKLRKAIQVGGVYFNIGGAYSSAKEIVHKIGMAIGSTAGYSHNYAGGGKMAVIKTAGQPDKQIAEHIDLFKKGPKTVTSGSLSADDTTRNVHRLGEFSHYHTVLYKSTLPAKAADGTTDLKSSYDIKLADATADGKVEAFFTAHSTVPANKDMFITSNEELISSLGDADKVMVKPGKYAKYLVYADAVDSGNLSLQEDQLVITNAPWEFDATDDKKVQLVQGPSLIGVHTNATEDAYLPKFVEWLMNGADITIEMNHKTYTGKPAEVFGLASGYVVPTKTAFSGSIPAGMNPAQTLAFNTLKNINDNSDMHAFDNPVDYTTGHFRDVLQTNISAMMNETGDEVLDASAIYTAVHRSLD